MVTPRGKVLSGGTPEEEGEVKFLRRLGTILAGTRMSKGLILK